MDELINSVDTDVFLCQEHWLTPANLHKFARTILQITFVSVVRQ